MGIDLKKMIKNFVNSRHSEQTNAMFHEWLVNDDFERDKETALHSLWDDTSGRMSREDLDRSFSQVTSKAGVRLSPGAWKRDVSRLGRTAVAAAITGIAAFSSFFLARQYYDTDDVLMAECYVKSGERSTTILPDGSEVKLNSGSHIYYPENMEGKTRIVYLIGEACFSVAKDPDRPFIVRSDAMQVEALGTVFDIKAYSEDDVVSVSLIQGKVAVNCGDSDNLILSPGQQVRYSKSDGTSSISDADMYDITAWQRGEIVLSGADVREIFNTISLRYGVDIRFSGAVKDKDRYNIVLKETDDLDDVLTAISMVVEGFTYSIEGNTCYIRWK